VDAPRGNNYEKSGLIADQAVRLLEVAWCVG